MRKLPDGLRKESNEQSTFDESSFELDLSELGIEGPAPAEKSEEYYTELPQEEAKIPEEKIEAPYKTDSIQEQTEVAGEKFDELLVESIDEAISSLGEPVKNAVYIHLQNDCSIRKKDIPKNLEEFSKIIHKIFGLGASRLEIKFLKNLNSKIESDIKMPECNVAVSKWIVNDLSFNALVGDTRKKYLKQGEKCQEAPLQN